jgi:hypothetical protein
MRGKTVVCSGVATNISSALITQDECWPSLVGRTSGSQGVQLNSSGTGIDDEWSVDTPRSVNGVCPAPWPNIRIPCSDALLLRPRTRRHARRVYARPMKGNVAHVCDALEAVQYDNHPYARLGCNRLHGGLFSISPSWAAFGVS